ncbi:right-handed parallel beta-helix repeat-containing protein [Pedobacter glucosidilyticus]|uniref:right-handed parallel beta-helix repeat-containing protein n=1 Tax=Pedobacter glucosidilyticus TaxID=1122941 RepID=UPI000688CA9F|nr:right-handed parallel beta-helix repeat-containing protein [Pedobacter glucosidilyticus]
MEKFYLFILVVFCLNVKDLYAAQYTVGTVTELRSAISAVQAGDVILLNGGTYTFTTRLEIKNKSGNVTQKITLMANPSSVTRPKFDFSAMPENSSNVGVLVENSNYWHIKGIDIFKAGDNGLQIKSSNNNIIEFCTFSECADSGLQIDNGSASNLILNCDSFFNADSSLENADGFACKLTAGTGNIFRGCRAWQNLDDGWDGYLRGADNISTTYENCWAFDNGKLKSGAVSGGDGNGFKTGGSDLKDLKHNAVLKNCLAVGNISKGFDHNSNRGEVTLFNCAATGNASNMGFSNTNPLSKLTIKNSLVLGSTGSVNATVLDVTNNSWNSSPAVSVTAADFASVDAADLKLPRKSDGSLPDINFFKLLANSDLVDRGIDVGLTFSGSAPDIGAFEYVAPLPLDLLKFEAQRMINQSTVKLTWLTTNEVNTKDFEVLRRGDDTPFVKIHTQTAKNTSGIHYYEFIDKNPPLGKAYYQLKQNDKDGKFTLSDVVFVAGFTSANIFSIYPNPVQEIMNIKSLEELRGVKIIFENLLGQKIFEDTLNFVVGENPINIQYLPQSIYTMYVVKNHDVLLVKKVVKK